MMSFMKLFKSSVQSENILLKTMNEIFIIEFDHIDMFFIDDSEETDKTYVENLLLTLIRFTDHITLVIAFFDIAFIFLKKDCISHSRFKISIDIHVESICHISAQSDLIILLRMMSLII